MELVFLKAKQRLAKEISNKGTTPYPLTKNFTSEHIQISKSKKGWSSVRISSALNL